MRRKPVYGSSPFLPSSTMLLIHRAVWAMKIVTRLVSEGIMIWNLYLIIYFSEANSFLGGMTTTYFSPVVAIRMSGCLSLICLYEVRALFTLFK